MSDLHMRQRDRLGPPPVEPLSEISWQRVERAVYAELDAAVVAEQRPARTTRWWAFTLVPLAAAAAAVALWVGTRPEMVSMPEPIASLPSAETPLRVATNGAPTDVNFGDAVVTVASHSALVMRGSADRGVSIDIDRGSATFAVSPRHGRPPFHVQAGEVSVRVLGTRFMVSRSGDAASVQVMEGSVEVVSRGSRAVLRAGDSWSSSSDREAAAQGPATAGVAAVPLPPPDVAEPPGPRPKVKRDSDDDDDARPRPPTSKEQFDAAQRLEATQPAQALEQYRELARGSGRWAANALFAAGRLSFERGDHEAAKRLLGRYLRRFPRGDNAADARGLLDRLEGSAP